VGLFEQAQKARRAGTKYIERTIQVIVRLGKENSDLSGLASILLKLFVCISYGLITSHAKKRSPIHPEILSNLPKEDSLEIF
jgi:hypothetical protein